MTYRNPSLLKHAQFAPYCMGCGKHNDGTIVAAHRNEGKGMGIKSSDAAIAFLCSECHHEYDNGKSMTKQERREFGNKAVANTLIWMIENKVLKCS